MNGIRLSPNYPTGHQWYSYYLSKNVRDAEAAAEMLKAHQLDPLSHVITLSLAGAYDALDRFAEASPLYAQGLAQSPEAWYAWGMRGGHELALGHVDQAVFAYKRWLVGMGDDTASVRNLEQELKDPETRAVAIARMVQRKDMHAAVAFSRWLIGDDALVGLLQKTPSAGRGPTPVALLRAILGPRLRSDPRLRALLARYIVSSNG